MKTSPSLTALLPLLFIAQVLGQHDSSPSRVSTPVVYSGMCGASAGAAVDGDLFIAADDETNQLRVYRRDTGGPALQVLDLTAELDLDRHAPGMDIEGAARIGDRVYWITSHSRNHLGREHANRYRFFATTFERGTNGVRMSFVGQPYKGLLSDLTEAPSLRPFDLRAASQRPPKALGALNIEGLCATPDGKLLIGFRNPIPGGKALIVPLENPEEVIAGHHARFGDPIQLDFNGLGIRDMAYWDGRYIVIAGSHDSGGKPKLYVWAGPGTAPRHLREIDLKGLNPEAVIIYPDKGFHEIQLLSDDSSHQIIPCKDLPPESRHFRSVWVQPENRGKHKHDEHR